MKVPIGLCVVVPVLIVGSMNLVPDRRDTGGGLARNGSFVKFPFTFRSVLVYAHAPWRA